MSDPQKILIAHLLLLATSAFSQGNLSPHVINKDFRFEKGKTIFSVTVSDSVIFQKKYNGKITVHHKANAKCFAIIPLENGVLEELKKDPNVLFLDHHRKAVVEGALDFSNRSFNRITKANQLFQNLNGANQNVSIKEQSFDPANIDLITRSFSTGVTPSSVSQHATTMAILIAGGGNSSFRARGVAPQAHFTSSDFNNLLPDATSIFNSNNIHVQNHSYGVDIENYYGNEAVAYDQLVYQNPDLLHVFSAGNSGKLKPSTGIYQNIEFANLTGNFKQAKNVLVVTAVDTALSINPLNSRGPAFDGRIKPELTAYGQGGTSEAAALVSGISALIQQKYRAQNQELPDASMTKAILIASAQDIGTSGIDHLYGYGNVNAYNAIKLIEQNQFSKVTLLSNSQIALPINIPTSISEIKIAVAWTDPPASVNSNSVLINDIDSWLDQTGVGTITLPWILSTYPHVDSLLAAPKRKTDHLNNIEYITLTNPQPGSYQLILKSGNISNESQKVSVAYWLNEQKIFNWDFPIVADIVEGGGKNLLVWEAAANQIGQLAVQINQGSWQPVESGIDLNHYFYWKCPDTLANAKLKMTIGVNEFITNEFLISPLLKMKTIFICADSVGLAWNSFKNSTGYELYTMGDQYLKKIALAYDTLIVLPQSANQYFSVAPLLNGITGYKSVTINYTQQGAACFINLFTAGRLNATQVNVRLSLSTWYTIDHINIFKTINGTSRIFQNLTPTNSLLFDFYDTELVAGVMNYQAEIIFKNGLKKLSDLVKVPIEEKGKAILYPNPVTASSDLTILSEGGGIKFRVIDTLGRVAFEAELQLAEETLDILALPTGFYIYQLLSGDKVTDVGRFIKY